MLRDEELSGNARCAKQNKCGAVREEKHGNTERNERTCSRDEESKQINEEVDSDAADIPVVELK